MAWQWYAKLLEIIHRSNEVIAFLSTFWSWVADWWGPLCTDRLWKHCRHIKEVHFGKRPQSNNQPLNYRSLLNLEKNCSSADLFHMILYPIILSVLRCKTILYYSIVVPLWSLRSLRFKKKIIWLHYQFRNIPGFTNKNYVGLFLF